MPSTSCSEYSEYQIQEKYLINTQKIVKGHKITLKDTIRKQLMKSRGQTRNKAAQTAEPSEKITEYTEKYHALETIDDEHQMLRFIFYKRFKESRASQRGIKLFSRQTTRPRTTHTQIERQSQRFGATARLTKTSNDKRTLENESKYKSLEYQVHNSLNDNTKKPTIHFSSENIDPKMTEYLNLILQKKEKDEMEITELELRQMSQGITKRETRAKMEEQRQRSLNNSFLRRMKKQQNRGYGMQGKYESQGEYRRGEGCGSDQLVKSLKRKRFAQRAANDFHNAFRKNNSIESDESANSSKLSKDRKVEKSYLKTFTAKTGEKDLKEMRTAMTSARRELY